MNRPDNPSACPDARKATACAARSGVVQTSAELTVPLPSLLKLAISPVIKHEFNSLVDTYMSNLKKAF